MTDTDTAESGRVKASERLLLNDAGADVAITEATHAIYKIPANGRSIDYRFGVNPVADRALAFFGFHTKVGNVCNTIRNDKVKGPGTPDDEADSADEWFTALMTEGKWREAGELGARGPKYDDDVLAAALVQLAAAKGLSRTESDYAWLSSARDPQHADYDAMRKKRSALIASAEVKDAYRAESARRGIAQPQAKDVTGLL